MNIYGLMIALFVCHWLGDYTHLQTAKMLQAKAKGKPLLPIALHALVHTILMTFVLVFFTTSTTTLLWLLLLQWVTHFSIDVWKGKMNVWFPALSNPANQFHWIVFGFDQFLHHSIIVLMAYWVNNTPNFMQ